MYFSKFPVELKNMVWEVFTVNRLVIETPSGDRKHQFLTYPYTPPVLHIDQDSRAFGLKQYDRFENQRDQPGLKVKNEIYIDFNRDTFLSFSIDRDGAFTQKCSTDFETDLHKQIKHLVVSDREKFEQFMPHFTALKSVSGIGVIDIGLMMFDMNNRNYVKRFDLRFFDLTVVGNSHKIGLQRSQKEWDDLIAQKKKEQPDWVPFRVLHAGLHVAAPETETEIYEDGSEVLGLESAEVFEGFPIGGWEGTA